MPARMQYRAAGRRPPDMTNDGSRTSHSRLIDYIQRLESYLSTRNLFHLPLPVVVALPPRLYFRLRPTSTTALKRTHPSTLLNFRPRSLTLSKPPLTNPTDSPKPSPNAIDPLPSPSVPHYPACLHPPPPEPCSWGSLSGEGESWGLGDSSWLGARGWLCWWGVFRRENGREGGEVGVWKRGERR